MRKVYEVMDVASTAFILRKGKLTFELSQSDRYHVEGKEIIFGTEEPLIASRNNRDEYFRFQTVYVDDDAKIEIIPLPNLLKLIGIYNIGYSITKNIAKCLQITNRMYVKKEKNLSGHEIISKEYSKIYVDTIDALKREFGKFKPVWLAQLIDRFSNSLNYAKGKAFKEGSSASDFKLDIEKLEDLTFNLRAGSILCEEGDPGDEMYILNRGNLQVYIGGKKVFDIFEPGTVMGEMALLLGERRTATIKTVTDCNITIVKRENIKDIAENTQDFFLKIAVNLGQRQEHNCMLIREINELMQEEKDREGRPAAPKEKASYKELLSLLRELERYEAKYRNPWLISILGWVRERISKVRDVYS
jgi:CRP-like cAMP-binding protein